MSRPHIPGYRVHRRQVFWQIQLPLFLIAAALFAGALFFTTGGNGRTRLLADVALIVLVLPLLVLALIGIVLLWFVIILFGRFLSRLPLYTARAQEYTTRAQGALQRVADWSVRPFFWLHQANAALRRAGVFWLKNR